MRCLHSLCHMPQCTCSSQASLQGCAIAVALGRLLQNPLHALIACMHSCPLPPGTAFAGYSVERRCYSMALGRLMGEERPDMDEAARLVRLLVSMAMSDEEKLDQYREALALVSSVSKRGGAAGAGAGAVGTKGGAGVAPPQPASSDDLAGHAAYPQQELRWLILSCWNRGVHHARFFRHAEAAAYMQLARSMLMHSPSFAAEYKETMTDALNKTLAIQQRQRQPAHVQKEQANNVTAMGA